MKDRNLKVDDNWATPKEFYDILYKEFNFDYDPCPYNENEITDDINGLLIPWKGQSIFINPPYSRSIKEQFVLKAITYAKTGLATCVLLLPVSTSTKLFHDHILPNADDIRFVKGRIKFQKRSPDGSFYTPKNGGMHDSMVVIFKRKL